MATCISLCWAGEAGGEVSVPVGDWGGAGSVGGRNIDGGGGGGANAVRAKAGKKGGNIARVRERSQGTWKRWGGLCSDTRRKGKRQEIESQRGGGI